MISRLAGTQDFIDLSLFNYIVAQCKKHLETYHFSEIAVPVIESTELYRRTLKSRLEVICTEITAMATTAEIQKESICLRPEATPSIIRAFIENGITTIPWKIYTSGPIFRREGGLCHQFHEIHVEIIGTTSSSYDVRLITMFDRFFSQTLSIKNYALRLNFLGCSADQTEYKKAPCSPDNLCSTCANEWAQIQDQLDLLSVTYSSDPSLVPHFDYFNKTIFEFSSAQQGAPDSFCSGGHSDQLLDKLGGKNLQSVGAALSTEYLMTLLEPLRETLPLPQAPSLTVIMPLSPEQQMLALLIADNLLAQGLCVDLFLEKDSLTNMMRRANKMGASYCLLVGQEEQQARIVTIKNMITGAEDKIEQIDIYAYLTR